MPTYAFEIERRDIDSLAALRLREKTEVCEEGDAVWVRSECHDGEVDAQLRALPGTRFVVGDDGELTVHNQRVPSGHLPDGPWSPLTQWLQVELPVSKFAAKIEPSVRLKLVRGGEPAEANVLLTSASSWHDYAVTAPQIRLDRLSFAMNSSNDIVVRGTPLPPLTGQRFIEQSGVVLPAGWTWEMAIVPEVVRQSLSLDGGDLAMFNEDATYRLIHADAFVKATRSAVRASVAET